MQMPAEQTILITGCSTGIGRATAERLAAAGHRVYATARNPGSVADLEAKGCRTLALDVTDEASMEAAVARIDEEADGAVGVARQQRRLLASRARSRRSPWRRSGGSSRRTSSASSA